MSAQASSGLTGGDWLVLGLGALALLAGVHAALRLCGNDGLAHLWRGADGRASTSKFQAVMWTLALAWALLSMLLAEIFLANADSGLSVGWDAFQGGEAAVAGGNGSFQAEYLALLGIPIGTAVAAKAITSAKVASGTVKKAPASAARSLKRQAADLVGDDQGDPAILDFQLVIFNLLLLAYFAGTFLTEPARGLPELPETLLVLAGVSSGSYTLNKALERTTGPAISSVRPSRILLGPQPVPVEVYGGPFGRRDGDGGIDAWFEREDGDGDGSGLVDAGHAGGVAIAGMPLQVTEWAPDRIRALVPAHESAGEPVVPLGLNDLVVYDAAGTASEPARVEVVRTEVAADVPSDERLGTEVVALLEQPVADVRAIELQEEDLVAGAPLPEDEPGEAHLDGEPVKVAAGDEI